MDLKLDPESWDFIWVNGPLRKSETTQPYTETVAQRLKIRLLTFLGEWEFNTIYGVPYWQSLLGKKQASKSNIDSIFQQKILEEVGVKEITYFNSTFSNRQYSLSFKVKVVTDDISDLITINPIS